MRALAALHATKFLQFLLTSVYSYVVHSLCCRWDAISISVLWPRYVGCSFLIQNFGEIFHQQVPDVGHIQVDYYTRNTTLVTHITIHSQAKQNAARSAYLSIHLPKIAVLVAMNVIEARRALAASANTQITLPSLLLLRLRPHNYPPLPHLRAAKIVRSLFFHHDCIITTYTSLLLLHIIIVQVKLVVDQTA